VSVLRVSLFVKGLAATSARSVANSRPKAGVWTADSGLHGGAPCVHAVGAVSIRQPENLLMERHPMAWVPQFAAYMAPSEHRAGMGRVAKRMMPQVPLPGRRGRQDLPATMNLPPRKWRSTSTMENERARWIVFCWC